MTEETKPDWWPKLPYPETVFPMNAEGFREAVPDDMTATAIAGYLYREGWKVASEAIWAALQEAEEALRQEEKAN